MKRTMLYALLVLMSCDFQQPNESPVYPDLGEQKTPRIEAAQLEFEHLENTNFGDANQFIIDPKEVTKGDHVESHLWSYWKSQLNYIEGDIPQGIVIFDGEPDDDWGRGKSMKWQNCTLHQREYFSISKTGKLLEHKDIDSTLFYYDSDDRLRKIISYSDGGSTEIEYIQLYDYDDHGNVSSSAKFYEPEEGGIYLNHYSTFSYHQTDSGSYVKENFYGVEPDVPGVLRKSVVYSYFNPIGQLVREFHTYSAGATGITFFEYEKSSSGKFRTTKTNLNLSGERGLGTEIKVVDSLNRPLYSIDYSGKGSIYQKDSLVYLDSENQILTFSYDSDGLLHHSYFYQEVDDFDNLLTEMVYDSDPSRGNILFRHTEYENELTRMGTWYSQKSKTAYEGDTLPENWDYYQYRRFLDHPVYQNNWEYQNDSKLDELIERWVLSHL
ncbi:MAG: hypothetical protein AB8B56_19555 [Crocinitomicaceae bacterium]